MTRGIWRVTQFMGYLVVIGILILGVVPPVDAETPRRGGTLVYGLETEPGVLDPHIFGPWATARVVMHIFDALVTFDTTTGSTRPPIVGQLATSWDISPDGKVYTFHLRQGVKFHDGTPFNAEAVKANIERMTDKESPYYFERAYARQRVAWRWLEKTDILDDHTIRLTLSQPFSDFLAYLADKQQPSAMISPAAMKKYGNKAIAQHLVGAGPFKVVEQVLGEKVVLERFDGYWGKKPYLDRVIIRPIPDPASRVLALQTGEVDVITIPPPDSKDQLIKQGFNWMQGDVHHIWHIPLNLENEYIKHKKVRQALNYAVDKKGMAQYVLNSTVIPATHGITMPTAPSWDPELTVYEYDPEKAKALLAEAGFPDGFKIKFQVSTAGSGQLLPVPMMEYIQKNLRDVGVELEIDAYEWLSYVGMWIQGAKPDVAGMQMSTGRPYDHWISRVLHSKNDAPVGWNNGHVKDSVLDDLMDKATVEPDPAKAAALWKQAVKRTADEAYSLTVAHDLMPMVLGANVKGFKFPHLEWFSFRETWLEKK